MKPFTLFRLAATALALSSAIACAQLGLETSASSSSVARISEAGVLRVGMSGSQPPLNMTTRAGELIGMEVDLARLLANAIGVEAELVTMPFGDLLPALVDGKVDVVISGLTMTPERNLRVAFAGPYLVSGKAVLTKSAALAAAEEPSDVNQPLRMAALAGSTSESFVKRHLPEVELVATTDYDEAIRQVIDDEVTPCWRTIPLASSRSSRTPMPGSRPSSPPSPSNRSASRCPPMNRCSPTS
jgi:polar amino acid transport system substrate-binding protein